MIDYSKRRWQIAAPGAACSRGHAVAIEMGCGIGGPVFWCQCASCSAVGVGPTIGLAMGELQEATKS